MVLVSAIGAVTAGVLAGLTQSSHDPRFIMNYSLGSNLPIRAFLEVEHGWSVLLSVWVMLLLFAILGWRFALAISRESSHGARFIIGAQLAVLLPLSLFPIVFSPDMYAYVLWGRLYGVFGINPYLLHAPLAGSDQIITTLVKYYGNPPPSDDYGPAWTLMAGFVARVESAASLFWQLWTQRALAIVGAIAAAAGLLFAMRRRPVQMRVYSVALFAFHPLVLYETAVGGHNDILLVALAVWAFAIVDTLPLVAGLLIGAAVAFKLVAVVALPFLIIRAAKRRTANGVACAFVAAAVVALCLTPFWSGRQTFSALQTQGGLMIWSLGFILKSVMLRLAPFSPSVAQTAIQIALVGVFIAVALVSIVRFALWNRISDLWRTLTAFLWALPALNPWYVLWISPALVSGGRWATYAWWLGILIFIHYVFDVIPFPTGLAAASWVLLALNVATLAILAVPVVMALRSSPEVSEPSGA